MPTNSHDDRWLLPRRQTDYPTRDLISEAALHGRREATYLALAALFLVATVALIALGTSRPIDLSSMIAAVVPDVELPVAMVLPVGVIPLDQVPYWAGLIEMRMHPATRPLRMSERQVIKAPRLHKTAADPRIEAHARSVIYYRLHTLMSEMDGLPPLPSNGDEDAPVTAEEALKALLRFHPESPETGAELPRDCWAPGYREAVEAVEAAEKLVGRTGEPEERR